MSNATATSAGVVAASVVVDDEIAKALASADVGGQGTSEVDPTISLSQHNPNNKIDPITSLQDAIDGLSLAMFEALRGLRDAVAPESGSLQQANRSNNEKTVDENGRTTNTNDVDELWSSYCMSDPIVLEMIESHRCSDTAKTKVLKRDEFVRLISQIENEKDSLLVQKLANDVLLKSKQIDIAVDDIVITNDDDESNDNEGEIGTTNKRKQKTIVSSSSIPGMHRTRDEQMKYIEQLIEQNAMVSNELLQIYNIVTEKRNFCRTFIKQSTASLLDITEE